MIRTFAATISLLLMSVACANEKAFDLGGGLKLHLEEREFVSSEWEIELCPGSESVCLINGKVPFGVEGSTPKSYLYKLEITNGNQTYQLDISNMFNAWGKRPLEYSGTVKYFFGTCQNPKWCTFRGLFSDGAGSFVAEWKVRMGLTERTVITNSNDIVHLFITHIEPPTYE